MGKADKVNEGGWDRGQAPTCLVFLRLQPGKPFQD